MLDLEPGGLVSSGVLSSSVPEAHAAFHHCYEKTFTVELGLEALELGREEALKCGRFGLEGEGGVSGGRGVSRQKLGLSQRP